MKMLRKSSKVDTAYLRKNKTNSTVITDSALKPISCKDFIDSQELLVVKINQNITIKRDGSNNKIRKKITSKIKKCYDNIIILWNPCNLTSYLKFNYYCSEIITYDQSYVIEKLSIIKDGEKFRYVKFNKIKYYLSQNTQPSFLFGTSVSIYPLEKYKSIVVRNVSVCGFEHFPAYTNCSIFSPFSINNKFIDLFDKVKDNNKDEIKKRIWENINSLVSKTLVETIITYSIQQNKPTEGGIYHTYADLIYDMVMAQKSYFKKL